MAKERFTACAGCGQKKIMSDELRRGFNGKDDEGKTKCPECIVLDFYDKWGL